MSNARASLLAAVSVAAVLGGAWVVRALDGSETYPALPVGSWTIQVRPDPGSPVPAGVNFVAFTSDGIVVNSNVSGLAGIGSWSKVGSRSYGVTFSGFEVTDGQQLRFVIRATLELSAASAELDGPFLTDIYTADGTLVASVHGTVHGERLTVQPMP